MSNRKVILFYSSVNNKKLFEISGFYKTDIEILRDLGYEIKLSNRITDFCFFWRYHFAHIYFYRKGLLAAILARFFNKKVIFTGGIDGLDRNVINSNKEQQLQRWLFKACYLFASKCNIVSASDLYNVSCIVNDKSKLVYFPHVIKVEDFEYTGNEKQNIISTIVWMEEKANVIRKGVDKLLYVFSEFEKINKEFKVMIVGKIGKGTEYLKGIIDNLGIDPSKVIFTDVVSEQQKVSILKSSKYYFQLSEYEGFGIAAVEALASGNIVIHSGKGGLESVLSDHGIHINDSTNFRDIAKTLHNLEENSLDMETLMDGVNYVIDNFSYKNRLKEYKKLFLQLS